MNIKKFILIICLTVGAFCSTVSYAVTVTPTTQQTTNLDLLYVQTAPTAEITNVCDTSKQCQQKLTLNNVPAYFLTFNNGVPRVGGFIPNQLFITQYYEKSGKSTQLNTALLSMENGTVHEHLITIANPVYIESKNELVYDMTIIGRADSLQNNPHLKDVALFIDGVCASCVGRVPD